MKLRILSIALLLFTLTASSQTQKELETRLAQWCSNTVAGNHQALADMYYPKMFEVMPKDKVIEGLKNMSYSKGVRMLFLQTPIKAEYGKIKKIGAGSYCMVKYSSIIKMIFDIKMTREEGAQMVETLKAGMNTNDITFNETENSVTISKREEAIAIADALTANKWMFLNRTGRPLMAKILDEKVLKELGL